MEVPASVENIRGEICTDSPAEGRMSVDGSISALEHIRDLLLKGANLQRAVDTALSVAATAVPADRLLFARIDPRTAEVCYVSCTGGEPAEPTAPALLADHMAKRLAQDGLADDAHCRALALPARLAACVFGNHTKGGTALVVAGWGGWLDVLAVEGESVRSEARNFLSSALMLLQQWVDRHQQRGEASDLHSQIRRAKNEWEATVDALPQLVCLLDDDGVVVRANRALETLLLGRVRTVAGTRFTQLLDRLDILRGLYRTMGGDDQGLPENEPSQSEPSEEVQLWVWQQWSEALQEGPVTFTSLEGSGGRFFNLTIQSIKRTGGSDSSIRQQLAILMDVTERNQARRLLEDFNQELRLQVADKTEALLRANRRLERELAENAARRDELTLSEYRYHAFVENTLIGIYLATEGRITYHNRRLASMLGYGETEILGRPLAAILGAPCLQRSPLQAKPDAVSVGDECPVVRRDGKRIWVQLTQVPFPDADREIVIGNVLDITARKEFEDRLVESKKRTAQLSEQLLIAQERERRRIARELHDGVGQNINSIKLSLDQAISDFSPAGGNQQHAAELQQIAAALRASVEEVRRVSMGLRPSVLDDLGIGATLNWFARDFARAMPDVRVYADIDIEETDIDSLVKTEIFRIAQEAFNNIAKHAEANAVELSLTAEADEIVLRIRDNGRGIVGPDSMQAGVGLHSMQERAELTGGEFFIVTRDARGVALIGRWRRSRRLSAPSAPDGSRKR